MIKGVIKRILGVKCNQEVIADDIECKHQYNIEVITDDIESVTIYTCKLCGHVRRETVIF
jgi:hypothetical protein